MSAAPDSPPLQRAAWLQVRERGSTRLLHFYAGASRRFGRAGSRWFLHVITAYFVAFSPRARRVSRDYLRRALGREARLADVYRHFFCFATTIHDRVFLANDALRGFDVEIEGAELLTETLATGRGALLMGAHIGSFEVLNVVGQAHAGVSVAMAMYEENARKMSELRTALRARHAPEVIPLGRMDAMLQIRDRLEAGVFIGLLADRTLGGEATETVDLLGAKAELPVGPMRAAALLRQRVIFMCGTFEGGRRYRVRLEALADFSAPSSGPRDARVREALQTYADRMTATCRASPYNWFNFFPFWNGPA